MTKKKKLRQLKKKVGQTPNWTTTTKLDNGNKVGKERQTE
jgi:hypothetical protein